MASTLVPGATFKIKLAHVKTVFQSSLEAVFLVELTSSVHLATLKIAKSLVVSESGSSPAAVALYNVPLSVSAADVKLALNVFGGVTYVVLKSAGIWQYVVVYFENQDWYSKEMPYLIPKIFKSYFVDSASYAKTTAPFGLSEFPPLVAPSAASAANPAVGSRLDSLEKQISDLAVLVKSIVEPIGFLVALVSCLLDDNAVKTVQIKKNIISMKSAANNFASLMVRVSKDIACLRSEIDFGNMNYNSMLAAKPSFLSENTIEHVITL
ncbi:hypothetical protein G9A89_014466 [Geosiphon pyriformis]|nr:hypothetical protein G9A89_014466 [Geosiphon pyriformis]